MKWNTLQWFAGVHVVVGGVVMGLGLLCAFVSFVVSAGNLEVILGGVLSGVAIALVGLGLCAFGQFIRLVIAIEENTSRLVQDSAMALSRADFHAPAR